MWLLTTGAHVATVLALAVAVVTSTGNHHAALLCGVLSSAGTVLALRHPSPGFVLTALTPLLAVALDLDPLPFWTVTVFSAFAVTVRGLPLLFTGPFSCAANLAAAGLAGGTLSVHDNPAASVAGFCAVMSALAASSVRGQHRYWLTVRQRTRDAIANRESLVRRSVAEERVRIARDLHDSVGHHIAVLSMHLGAAEVSLSPDAGAARAHLTSARESVQGVLGEVQQILAVLRLETGGEDLLPTPDFSQVPELALRFRRAGLDLEDRLSGCGTALPHDVSAAAYRITQEALTNAQKHGTGTVWLNVHADDTTVRIDVVNTRTARSADTIGGGRGLIGLGERAESVGGRIEVRDDETTYRFLAELPAKGGRA